MKSLSLRRQGFTLIELLLVIGIIAILASIVIVAINPTKQLADARNAQRQSDVNTIVNAVYQYAIDNDGDLPGCLASGPSGAAVGSGYGICTSDCTGYVGGPSATCDMTDLEGTYLVDLPLDPSGPTTGYTGYNIDVSSNRVIVSAPLAEQSETIQVTR